MAEYNDQEKTEQPTAKHRKESREKGQVAKSTDLNSIAILLVSTLVLYTLGGSFIEELAAFTINIYQTSSNVIISKATLPILITDGISVSFGTLMLLLIVLVVTGIGINVVQVGTVFSLEAIKPKLGKISLLKGLKRIFSLRSISELIKGILKMSIVGLVCYFVIKNQVHEYEKLAMSSVSTVLTFLGLGIVRMIFYVSIVLVIVALGDFAYQKYDHEKNLKMSREEIKEENKQSEGNPQIKSKIKSLQMSASRRRMMASVPDATVVVTNPTHIAIAMQYKMEWKQKAPKVVAKGLRKTAERIKAIAGEHNVPIIENKPLARILNDTCEIGMEIPAALFQPVAEIIAQVYNLKYAN